MKWIFYVIVFIYMAYRAVYGAKSKDIKSLIVDRIDYGAYETYLPPNSYKTISCKYSNKNHKVEWLDSSENVIPLSATKRVATQKHTGPLVRGVRTYSLTLTFTDTEVDDTGEYECRSGDASEKVTLCVIAPAEFVDMSTEVVMDEGRSYTLSCQARGQPEPRIEWIRNGQQISDDGESSKYQVMTKYNSHGFEGLLTITSLTPEDSGEYTCMAIQEHTTVEDCSLTKHLNISVVVNYAPVFEDGNDTKIYSKYNETVEFVCTAGGYPEPTYRWFHALDDNTLYEYPKDSLIYAKDKSEVKFSIVADGLSFGQKYVCEAANQYGVASKYYTLLRVEKPERPSEVNVYNSSQSHLDLNVTWSKPVMFPIENVEVQLMPEGIRKRLPKEADWKKAADIQFAAQEFSEIEDDVVVVSLSDLEPESNYWVRIRVGNELGFSPWSLPIVASTNAAEEETLDESSTEDINKNSTTSMLDGDGGTSQSMYYGIFFAGGILVLIFICTIVMKIV
ncbi:unnamed protein product [Chilo suppressalis]|uniref:Uncharacterized protein n=1 Tax=Chilo suppressalis TaxID=168631 RepID=A0ABN8EDW7_CHISP|nr:unnamed protein product [Chilo suppressalis]